MSKKKAAHRDRELTRQIEIKAEMIAEIVGLRRQVSELQEECAAHYQTNIRLLENLVENEKDLRLYREQKISAMKKRLSAINAEPQGE